MNRVIFKEIGKDEYQALCTARDVPLTQNYFYGEWQVAIGKNVWRYKIEQGSRVLGFFQIIKYSLPFSRSYLYIPHGPVIVGDLPGDFWRDFKFFTTSFCGREKAVFLRFDSFILRMFIGGSMEDNFENNVLEIASSQASHNDNYSSFFRVPKLFYDGSFQPKFEWIIDLTKSEEEILADMKKVNRYTVRQAEKIGVETEIVRNNFVNYLDKFYDLIEDTAKRDEFFHNSKDYYRKVFNKCEEDGNAFMLITRLKGEIMLINFFVIYGDSVFFLFSGSENNNRKIGYTYLAQWGAIKYARGLGLKKYNFGAVISDQNEYRHYQRWQGFSDFKKRFGGSMIEYSDLYDAVYNRFWYFLYMLKKLTRL